MHTPQLVMTWPEQRLSTPPQPQLPEGYSLRTYQPGDEVRFYEVMALSGWPGWDSSKLRPWVARIPPDSWYMLMHDASGLMVATAMGLHDHTDWHPFGGELGWVASDPAHAGRGLGRAVCAAVTARLISAGYKHIHLYTEDFRLAALKTYLRLGYVPYFDRPESEVHWQTVYVKLGWQ